MATKSKIPKRHLKILEKKWKDVAWNNADMIALYWEIREFGEQYLRNKMLRDMKKLRDAL